MRKVQGLCHHCRGNNTRTGEGLYVGRGWGRGSLIVVSLVESVGESNSSMYGRSVSVFWREGVGSVVSSLSMCWKEGVGSLVSSLSMCWGEGVGSLVLSLSMCWGEGVRSLFSSLSCEGGIGEKSNLGHLFVEELGDEVQNSLSRIM